MRRIEMIERENMLLASISYFFHDLIWEAAELSEEIPVYALLASTPGVIEKTYGLGK
jgi:hypothetical protein